MQLNLLLWWKVWSIPSGSASNKSENCPTECVLLDWLDLEVIHTNTPVSLPLVCALICYTNKCALISANKNPVLYLFNVFHAMQELIGNGVQLEQIHAIEGALQQLKDGGKLEWSSGFRQKGLPIQHMPCVKYIPYPRYPNPESVVMDKKMWGYAFLRFLKRDIHAHSDPGHSTGQQATNTQQPRCALEALVWKTDRMTLHLDIFVSSFPKFFQPELCLAWVHCWRRSDAGALALRSRRDCLHSVEVLRSGAPVFYPPAGAPAQGSDNTFTPTVRAFREGFHFVIITQQLQREEDECIFHHS